MSNNKDSITLDISTNRADFRICDVITTLFLLADETMGRYKLMDELDITESNVKSLLAYCKNNQLVKASVGRGGHSIDNKGIKVVKMLQEHLLDNGFLDYKIFNGKKNFILIVKSITNFLQSWKIRDIALSCGGEAILVLVVDENGKIEFPEKDIQIESYYPNLQEAITSRIAFSLKNEMVVLIFGAVKKQIARKSAFETLVSIIPDLGIKIIQ